jgi:hypothetical protein
MSGENRYSATQIYTIHNIINFTFEQILLVYEKIFKDPVTGGTFLK